MPGRLVISAITVSASLSWGTALGETNEVTSMRGMPVAASLFTTSILASVGMKSGSIWNPSRVPTSQMVTRLGSFMASPQAPKVNVLPTELTTSSFGRCTAIWMTASSPVQCCGIR